MSRRRLITLGATVGVALLLVLFVLLAPVQASQFVKGSYQALPQGVRDAVPDGAERAVGQSIDRLVLALAGNNPRLLITIPLVLESSSVPVGGWTSRPAVTLNWTDLGHDGVAYGVLTGSTSDPEAAEPVLTVAASHAAVPFPGEGRIWVHVVPTADGREGTWNTFGPFGHDATPPPAPQLDPRADPPGYTFRLTWGAVDDLSGITHYELARRTGSDGAFLEVARTPATEHTEHNLGNGAYTYRVRAVNGAGLASPWSPGLELVVSAPMSNPGVGAKDYGIHANYTSFMKLWDLADPSAYLDLADLDQPPHAAIRDAHVRAEWGIETGNATLQALVASLVGGQTNTFLIAETLFLWLYGEMAYDHAKAAGTDQGLLRAGETLDRGGGICGDLAVLYITLLRIAGVPARPVHGYLDNPEGAVRGEFHMWVEAYVGGDPDHPWMTIDVSGATGDPERADRSFFLFFGLFNPDYLALGTELVFDPPDKDKASWNAWARFQWTCTGSQCRPTLDADGVPANLEVDRMWLLVEEDSRNRALVAQEPGKNQPTPPPGFSCGPGSCFFWEVNARVHKVIDYGVDVRDAPADLKSLKIELRHPLPDAFGRTNPYQSVIYTVYQNGQAVTGLEEPDGFVRFTHMGG